MPPSLFCGGRGVRVELWDWCTRVLHPFHDAPRTLFPRARPAPTGDGTTGYVESYVLHTASMSKSGRVS